MHFFNTAAPNDTTSGADDPKKDVSQRGDPPKTKKLLLQIAGENFWDLIVFNLLYTLFCLPTLLALLCFWLELPLLLAAGMLVLSAFSAGPASTAFARLVCCWLRGTAYEPYRIFFTALRDNWKSGIKLGLCYHTAFALLLFAANFYLFNLSARLFAMLLWLTMLLGILLILLQFYSYMMLANVNLTLRQILRNSLLLSASSGKRSLAMLGVTFGVTAITFLAPPFTLCLIPLIYFSTLWLLCGALAWNTISEFAAIAPTDTNSDE